MATDNRHNDKESSSEQQLIDALREFALAESWSEWKQVLTSHPELLTDEADVTKVEAMASWPADIREASVLSRTLEILQACRDYGTATAFGALWFANHVTTTQWSAAIADPAEELTQLAFQARDDPGLYPRVISLAKGILRRLGREDPSNRAILLGMMGDAYIAMTNGDRTSNLEHAISCYQEELKFVDPTTMPERYAITLSVLGIAIRRLPTGDRIANLERAISCFREALRVYPPTSPPITYAELQNNLGNAYLDRLLGNSANMIEDAIQCFDEVLKVFDPVTSPREYGQVQNGLGTAYLRRIRGRRSANLHRAIECYREALKFSTSKTAPMDYAMTQSNLGRAYADLVTGDQAENLKQSIKCCEEALRYWTEEVSPFDYAAVQTLLGKTFAEFSRIEETAANLERAVQCLQKALRIRTAEAVPSDHCSTAARLGLVHFSRSEWEDAHAAYTSAISAFELLYEATATVAGRQAQLGGATNVVSDDAYCLAKLARLTEAVERLEGGRARTLADVLARDRASLEKASGEDRDAFSVARSRIEALEAEARRNDDGLLEVHEGSSFVELSDKLAAARDQLSEVIERIRSYVPEFMATGLSYSEITMAATAKRPLVYLLTTARGSLALIVTAGGAVDDDGTLWLNEFTGKDLAALLFADEHEGTADGLLGAQVNGGLERLSTALQRVLPILRTRLMKPLAERLAELGFSQATMIPTGWLSLLPLPAAAPQDLILAVAPSARTLRAGQAAAAKHSTDSSHVLLAVGNPLPLPQGMEGLAFARAEAEAIGAIFGPGCEVLVERAAKREHILSKLHGATHLHLACHGNFDPDEPLDSSLWLSGGERLMLRDLLDGEFDLSAVRLAVLSACQSGITEWERMPDEAIGMPAGFHQAGVSGVVSTLWPVDDISTAMLVAEFYRLVLTGGLDLANALRKAQIFLHISTARQMDLASWFERAYQTSGGTDAQAFEAATYYRANPDKRPFENPLYWAGFVFTGV